jgi:hypothetical protein
MDHSGCERRCWEHFCSRDLASFDIAIYTSPSNSLIHFLPTLHTHHRTYSSSELITSLTMGKDSFAPGMLAFPSSGACGGKRTAIEAQHDTRRIEVEKLATDSQSSS